MTPGNNGASTPEDDDPFGYLYADGQANGAQPPSGGYGYPNSVNRVRAVGQRQYGGAQQPQQTGQYGSSGAPGQTAAYGQVPQQQAYGTYGPPGQPNPHYAAPETVPGGQPPGRREQAGGNGGGRGRGPNTKGLLIGAIAVVAAVVIGIGIAMLGGDDDKKDSAGGDTTPTASSSPTPSKSGEDGSGDSGKLPTTDAKTLKLDGGATTASDVKGAKADGGSYVTNFNHEGAAVTWTVNGIAKSGKYTLYVGYGVPGKDANATLTLNGEAQSRPINMSNFAKAPEGDYEKGWTSTWANIQLNKGTNTIRISCEQGNSCDANLDQLWLLEGWK
ncbi:MULTISPECIES: CBM35 domain-containing protein [Streptomyces]|jgi:hypothetical protein|uniref:CBM35 domain-containing protein n=1 Tax=Streptomyces TaxID=1883 RepID=UPI00177C593A|nr:MULTISPECIES: CBM35 domain-containing protein [unclassified Streptomyces]MDX3087513.1 CBM35 domain-containing protein [Streptomyces sp. ME12-02E]MDX3330868.1 CBM35 domain-containing protein [Streptomyces sp. ME02-6978a]GHE34695.1 hypothetical protein GCM10018782_06230 [Streptomyces griseoaurantiacus]